MITLSDLTPVSQALPPIGTTCLIYTVQGGYTVAKFTDRNSTYGYHYKTARFCKSGRQMSKKTVVGWCELKNK